MSQENNTNLTKNHKNRIGIIGNFNKGGGNPLGL